LNTEDRIGVSPYGKIYNFGTQANRVAHELNIEKFVTRKEAKKRMRKADRNRQRNEKGLNWAYIRMLLDSNRGLTLEDAKRIAGGSK
jgi:hypothetical protein